MLLVVAVASAGVAKQLEHTFSSEDRETAAKAGSASRGLLFWGSERRSSGLVGHFGRARFLCQLCSFPPSPPPLLMARRCFECGTVVPVVTAVAVEMN